MIEVKRNGNVFYTIEDICDGSKLSRQLMDHHYIILKFSTVEPVYFEIGDTVEIPSFGYFELTSAYFPKYNENDGYDYELQLDAYYMSWKNKKCKYRPKYGANETSFKLTSSVSVHTKIVLDNLGALGYKYNGKDYSVDFTTYNDKVFDVEKRFLVEYSSISILDAITNIAEKLECEWWVDGSIIYFGYCEMVGQTVFEQGKNVLSMSYSESKAEFITRLYAFGSDKNIPKGYFTGEETDVTTDGIATDYLMLPDQPVDADGFISKDGYLENVNIVKNLAQAIEGVVMFQDEYPKVECVISDIKTYDSTVNNEDGSTTTQTFWQVTSNDSFATKFDKSWIKADLKLMIHFTSGPLLSMEFEVEYKVIDGKNYFEVIVNDKYGRSLPDKYLYPKVGDKFFLFNWDSTKITETDLIQEAQTSLLERAKNYYKKSMISNANFDCVIDSHDFYNNGTYDYHPLGEQVKLINPVFADVDGDGKHYRNSRIIGMEICLDIPYDAPTYIVGEKAAYSKLGQLEDKVNSITVNGIQIGQTGTISGGGVYVIGMNDSTPSSDSNVYSARRSDSQFLRRDKDDTAAGTIRFLREQHLQGGAKFGKSFVPGLYGIGGRIDGDGYGELRGLRLWEWLEVPEIRYNRVQYVLGLGIRAVGGGIIESVVIDTTTDSDGNTVNTMTGGVYLKLEDGEYGAVDVDDMHMGLWHDMDGGNATANTDNKKGIFEMRGFKTSYFRVIEIPATDPEGKDNSDQHYFRYVLRPLNDGGNGVHPFDMMHFGLRGNFTKKDRQNFVYETTEYEMKLTGVNTWTFQDSNIYYISGILDGFTMESIAEDGSTYIKHFSGYGSVLGNAYIYGTIDQFERAAVRMEIDTQGMRDLAFGESVLMTCTLKKAGFDVTDKVTRWDITRDSGDPAEDAAWALKPKVKAFNGSMMLSFTDTDNDLSLKVPVTAFTIKAYQDETQIAEAILSI